MYTKQLPVLLVAILISTGIYAQDYITFKGKIRITNAHRVVRIDKVTITEQLPAGTTYTEKASYDNNGTPQSIDIEHTVPAAGLVTTQKTTHEQAIQNMEGWANLYEDDDDPSIIHINYYLNATHIVPGGYQVQEFNYTWADANATVMTPVVASPPMVTLANPTSYTLWKVMPGSAEEAEEWYTYTPRRVDVYKDGKLQYHLVDRYCSDCDYQLQLTNRQAISFSSYSFDLGTITVPFKIRPGFTNNGNRANTDISADFNVGIFGGASYGRTRYRSEKDGLKTLPEVKGTLGAFLNLGVQDLDTLSSNATEKPLGADEKRTMMTLSVGVGTMLSFANIKLGMFVGTDIGMGPLAKSWNFNKKPWIGVGLGYNLASLWGKN